MKTKRVLLVSTGREAVPEAEAKAARARIVAAARTLFLDRGYLRTTSDDIAAELGMSKATLYRTFRSKEDILHAVVREIMEEILAGVERLIHDPALGFVERMVGLLSHLVREMAQFGPAFVRDIQKGAPAVWQDIHDFRQDKILRNFRIILESGLREGYFRDDVDRDLLLRMFLGLVQDLVTPEEVRRTGRPPAVLFESVIKVFFQGILTDKGRQDFFARTPALFEPRKEGAP